ncbi:metal ABC transporter permease [Akkermansiaceae bacterium]|nr:metal ABC transporter permease [bacterium]MDB4435956.1 metal ABC transporter permease [Akkermansiaceae bacterium]
MPTDSAILLVGILCACACALPGCFLLLRRMSMMGDAISHAVLPGLALAFLISHSRASWVMFIGAALAGILTALFTQWITKFGKVDRGAAMGIVFTTLFAIGLILIRQGADHVDLDAGCVLYGAIEYTALDQVTLWENDEVALEVPRAALVTGGALLFNILVIGLFYKELTLASFDPALARTVGFRPQLMHYLLMTMVAVTTVASFEAVGSIIVIAMLIVPPATAFLLTRNLPLLIGLSLTFAALSAVLGHLTAISLPKLTGLPETTSSGVMATMAGVLFLLAWMFGPNGLLRRRGRLAASA